jgi:ATP-dependent helicase/nuclease subunit B
MRDKVFTIPTGTAFLPALVKALLNGDLPQPGGSKPDPIDLSGMTILLPTRRAERALADTCLSVSGRKAMLLPRIRTIAGPDEDSLLIGAAAARELGPGTAALELPPAIGKTERLLLLTQLVEKWSEANRGSGSDPSGELGIGPVLSAGARTPAQAASMARELASLMDLVEREGRDLSGISEIVPSNFSEHWQDTLKFLEIITDSWPKVLREMGFLSPWDRQNRLLAAEAQRLRQTPPAGPVIVAGVTGSIPATVDLMKAVAGLEQGAIVLQGLDQRLDDLSWESIAPGHPEHPDFGFKGLLSSLSVSRSDVRPVAGSEPSKVLSARSRFVSESMRPTETTASWHGWVAKADKDAIADGLADVSLIEAANPQEEAEAIALIMRESVELQDKSAALVTPDRLLARRVAIRLEAWGIRVDDSAGRPFAKTVPGAFLEVVIDAVARNFAPVPTMALLKHPLARFGLSAREARFGARSLELAVFRTTYIGDGLQGIAVALERAKQESDSGERRDVAVQRLWDEDWERAQDLLRRLAEATEPLVEALTDKRKWPLRELAQRHIAVSEAASRLTEEETEAGIEAPLYSGESGEAAARFFTDLLASTDSSLEIAGVYYPDLYRSLISTLPPVIPRVPKHPRLSIWGPMESQLLSADTVILGSLNEATWPDSTDPGPWLNRPMRADLGLPAPEEDIGREARGFVSLLGAGTVYLTRAKKVDGVPSVPSRWLMRISALLGGLELQTALQPPQPWLEWARSRDVFESAPPPKPPAPCPPIDARPRRISVSGIERWIANPYAIYAGEILKLKVLPKLGAEPDAALRGKILHEAMSRFAQEYPVTLPADTTDRLTAAAREILDTHASHPRIAAFWLPRFERFAAWFAATEAERREGLDRTLAEVAGALSFSAPAGEFTLTARADRLDVSPAGLVITDYKTGKPPNPKAVVSGQRPQLPLEAAIAISGGFPGLPALPIADLRYIEASGGEPPGDQKTITVDDIAGLAEQVLRGVKELIARFDEPDTPYAATRRAGFSYDYDDYAHLARVLEWSQATALGDGAEGGEA